MTDDDRAYWRRRARQARLCAANATDVSARAAHLVMAHLYEAKIAPLDPDPNTASLSSVAALPTPVPNQESLT